MPHDAGAQAAQYQLFPDLSPDEYEQLKADIADRGVMVPVEYDDAGNILDGHHRERICRELGIDDFPSIVRYGLSDAEKRLHVRKLNLARRHLNREQRNAVMREMRAEGMTTPAIAEAVGVSDETARQETKGVSKNLETVTGRDGKQYPATKPRKPAPALFTETAEQRTKATEPETAERIASGKVKASNKLNLGGAHVGKNAGENEWYTPEEFAKAARKVLGKIGLDPASTAVANEVIKAKTFYTAEDDGLSKAWKGRVWMNPPYASGLIEKFTNKLAASYEAGGVTAAIALVNNATETRWFQFCANAATSICFPAGRVKFWHPERESAPLQGQAILYFGDDAAKFESAFTAFGLVVEVSK